MIDNFYEDFRRTHIEMLVNNLVCDSILHGEFCADDRSFDFRYKELRIELLDNLIRFFNVISKEVNTLSVNDKIEMFSEICFSNFDKMLNIFFEAGLHSGIVFSLDMELINQSKLFEIDVTNKIKNNESIIKI